MYNNVSIHDLMYCTYNKMILNHDIEIFSFLICKLNIPHKPIMQRNILLLHWSKLIFWKKYSRSFMRELKLKSKQLNKRKGIFGTAIVHRSAVPKYRGVSPSQRFISGNQKNPYLSFQQNYLPPSHCTASIHRYISAVNSSSRDRNKNKR